MSRLSLTSLLSTDSESESGDVNTESPIPVSYEPHFNFYSNLVLIINILMFIVSCFGIVANGAIIWILGFGMKVYPFTIYILNLAITDVGVLITRMVSFLFLAVTKEPVSLESVYFKFFLFMCIIDQFLLTAISIDRALSATFPVWHQYHLPAYLPIIVCIVIWTLSFLFSAFHFVHFSLGVNDDASMALHPFMMTALVCLPLMTISTVIILVRVCFKTQDYQRVTLLMAITTTLLLSILFLFPLNIISMIRLSQHTYIYTLELGYLGACLNSGVKPLVYFLAGRKKMVQSQRSIRVALQTVFKEGEDYGQEMELELPVQT